MTRTELLDHLSAMTPTQRRAVLAMAKTIRCAREHGDTRPAAQICAHLAQPGRKIVLH